MMIVTAIIGVLASVAIPSFRLMNDRAKASERGAVIRSMKNSINALRVKDGSFGAGITGAWNPVLPLSTVKRPFAVTMAGWDKLDLLIDGNLYYSYAFTAAENDPPDPPTFWIFTQGDIDGNGDAYWASYTFEMRNGAFVQTSADPSAVYEYTVF
jgi:type II secretory pathway pseudopilin PulG